MTAYAVDHEALAEAIGALSDLPIAERIEAINHLRLAIHAISPFNTEPVDCVQWIPAEKVVANDYNPNTVAPPEMRLLELSIQQDGYTQPIVGWQRDEDTYEVVDGFHRHRVGQESFEVAARIHGYLPVAIIKSDEEARSDRMASTIRHNRARGKHGVTAMSDIVVELKRRNWTDQKIATELGMDQDEILRLCQITGLADLFEDEQFSRAWDVQGSISEDDFVPLTDNVDEYEQEIFETRVANVSDETRIFHTHDTWECFHAGFYENTKPGVTRAQGEETYRAFLAHDLRFEESLAHVIKHWKNSCEHYLTNIAMNRIAWLGQAAACNATGLPASYRGGFNLLNEHQQNHANEIALKYLNRWLTANGRPEVTMEEAYSYDRQSDIY